jgi:hypothetical protein
VRYHVFVCYGVSVPSQDSEMLCICALGVSVPSQESEMSCICLLAVTSQDSANI